MKNLHFPPKELWNDFTLLGSDTQGNHFKYKYSVGKEIRRLLDVLLVRTKWHRKELDDQEKYQTHAYKQREKQSRENRKYNYPCLFDPQGIHAIMPLDLIHLQKSWVGCKARFTADSDHEKASFPPTFHTDKELPHLHSMWETQLGICMWDRGTRVKNKHSPWMNV